MLDDMLVHDLYPKTDNGGELGVREEGGGIPHDSTKLDLAPYLEYQTYTE